MPGMHDHAPNSELLLQFFYRYLNGPEADNLPACPACVYDEVATWNQRDAVQENPDQFLDGDAPVLGTESVRSLSTFYVILYEPRTSFPNGTNLLGLGC